MVKKYDILYSLLCRQIKDANIPIPPAGYWTKTEYGKETVVAERKGNPDEIAELCKHVSLPLKNNDCLKTHANEKAKITNTPQSVIENNGTSEIFV